MNTSDFVSKDKVKMLFDPQVAKSVGTDTAIIFNNIVYWVTRKEEADDQESYHDGHYWTYNSARRFEEIFPWMNERKIARCLQKLEDKELVISGNYNKHKYDRTKWYSPKCSREECSLCQDIGQECQMDSPVTSNAEDTVVRPIPDSKHRVSNPSSNHYSGLEQTSVNKETNTTDFLSRGSERDSSSERTDASSRRIKDGRVSKRLAREAQVDRELYAARNGINPYFYEAWEIKFKQPYPWPSDYENDNIWETLDDLVVTWDEEFEILVDLYFLQEFREQTNYRVQHFLSEQIQSNLIGKIINTTTMKNEHRDKLYR